MQKTADITQQAPGTTLPQPGGESGGGDSLRAWKALLRSHAILTRALDAELQAGEQLSLGDFDVLASLAAAPRRRLTMCDLAEAVVLSRSGLTRRIDRLQQAGLVTRARGELDGRSVEAALTDAGRERLRRARATHLGGVEKRFQSHFDEQELDTLAELLGRLIDGDEEDGC